MTFNSKKMANSKTALIPFPFFLPTDQESLLLAAISLRYVSWSPLARYGTSCSWACLLPLLCLTVRFVSICFDYQMLTLGLRLDLPLSGGLFEDDHHARSLEDSVFCHRVAVSVHVTFVYRCRHIFYPCAPLHICHVWRSAWLTGPDSARAVFPQMLEIICDWWLLYARHTVGKFGLIAPLCQALISLLLTVVHQPQISYPEREHIECSCKVDDEHAHEQYATNTARTWEHTVVTRKSISMRQIRTATGLRHLQTRIPVRERPPTERRGVQDAKLDKSIRQDRQQRSIRQLRGERPSQGIAAIFLL